MAYGDFKNLARRTASDNVLRNKELDIAKNPSYNGYQRGLGSMDYKFFDKKLAGSGVTTLAKESAFNNEQLAEELQKPTIKESKTNILHSKTIFGVLI